MRQLFSDSFKISDRALGSGICGRVYLASHNEQQLACKVVGFVGLWNKICTNYKHQHNERKRRAMWLEFKKTKTDNLEEVKLWKKLDHVRAGGTLPETSFY